jgi:hypothetical protein
VKVGGDLRGGSIGGTDATVDASGIILSNQHIASVTIGGSIITGIDDSTAGSLTDNASVRAGYDIGSLTVKGSLVGNASPNGVTLVTIAAVGQSAPTATTNLAIGKISIGGFVKRVEILAGYDISLTATNGNAQIGAVTVGGDWIASSIAAGTQNTGGPGHFGDGNDSIIGGGASIAKIASITIGGIVSGSGLAGEHFGFVSHTVGPFASLGFTAPAISAPNTITLPTVTGDVTIVAV